MRRMPRPPLPACEWCGTGEAPDGLGWTTTIASPEPATDDGRLVVTEANRSHAAAGVTRPSGPRSERLHFYLHEQRRRLPEARATRTGNGRGWHGLSVRSWIRDGASRGTLPRLRDTSAPPPIRARADPRTHIHITVQPPGAEEYWIDSIVIRQIDPLLTDRASRNRRSSEMTRRSGPPALGPRSRRDEQGVSHGTRDSDSCRKTSPSACGRG